MRTLTALFLLVMVVLPSRAEPLRVHRIDKLGPSSKTSPRFDHVEARAEARSVFARLAREQQWHFSQASDSGLFTAAGLKEIDVLVFDNNSGVLFSGAEKLAFEAWVRRGGGVIGIHGATHAHKGAAEGNQAEWPFWYGLWGVLHKTGPKEGPQGRRGYADWIQMVVQGGHWTEHVPKRWKLEKVEWYFWNTHPNYEQVQVIATAEVKTNQPLLPEYYPVTWCRDYEGGRVWYTNMGHYAENYRQEEFVRHLLDGIQWVSEGSEK